MPRKRGGGAAAILLVALLLGVLSFGPASAQEGSKALQGEVVYDAMLGRSMGYMAAGSAPDGAGEPFDGCGYAKVRDDLTRARMLVAGFLPSEALLSIDMSPLSTPGNEPIRRGLEVGAPPGSPLGEVETYMLLEGEARLAVNGEPYGDPVTNESAYEARFFVTQENVREDATGALVDDGGTDWEVHLNLRGAPGTGSGETRWSTSQPPAPVLPEPAPPMSLPVPTRFIRETEHQAIYPFDNRHFGGDVTVRFEATSEAPAGQTALTFALRGPDGSVVERKALRPSVGSPASGEITAPLDAFGTYTIAVNGSAILATYDVDVVQSSDGPMDLWFWWEDVAFGVEAIEGERECVNLINAQDGRGAVTHTVDRPRPPGLAVLLAFMGGVAAVAVFLVASKLIGQTIASADFRRTYRKS